MGAREVARLLGLSPNTERRWRLSLGEALLLEALREALSAPSRGCAGLVLFWRRVCDAAVATVEAAMRSFFMPRDPHLALWSLWSCLVLGACDPMNAPCDGLDPKDGEAVDIQLTLLGYGQYSEWDEDGEDILPDSEIVEDEARWTELVEVMGTDGGVSPDFDSQVAFLNGWDDRGCGDEAPTYGAWRWDDTVRIRRLDGEACHNDMVLPNMDIGLIERGSATDYGWCE